MNNSAEYVGKTGPFAQVTLRVNNGYSLVWYIYQDNLYVCYAYNRHSVWVYCPIPQPNTLKGNDGLARMRQTGFHNHKIHNIKTAAGVKLECWKID